MERLRVIDSHTGGEPARVVVAGGPDLGPGTLAARRARFHAHHDRYRRAIVNEPRGSDVLVGALLCPPHEPGSATGVIFFNNVGYLGMCGHGTIGVVATLAHLGTLAPGRHRIDTPVGVVGVELHAEGRVSVDNVPSWRHAAEVIVDVPGHGLVCGDVAWGGNWFFLVRQRRLDLALPHVAALSDLCSAVRIALQRAGITGADGAEIDHIELSGPPSGAAADSRNFVLCPGNAYDRSPCGTGTSAKLACLHADGALAPGACYRQESVTGSVFEASVAVDPERPGVVLPRIAGTAHVIADATLLLDPRDPLCWGIAPAP